MPSLPFDLERLIFELAALQDTDHDSRVRLILVAKRVYEWIRPILYHVAIVARVSSLGNLTIQNWRKAPIYDVAPFTRHLLSFAGNLTNYHIVALLSTFYNAENVAIWCNGYIGPQVLEKMNDLPLRMLSVGPAYINLDEAIKYCPAFRNITHLEMVSLKGPTWDDCRALEGFPKLTHLCFDVSARDGVVLEWLERCPSLRVMIYQPVSKCTIETDDPRFLVLLDHMSVGDFVEEWERSANGGIGLWELADIIIEARKDKLFKDNTFTLSRRTWMDSLNEDGKRWYEERFDP